VAKFEKGRVSYYRVSLYRENARDSEGKKDAAKCRMGHKGFMAAKGGKRTFQKKKIGRKEALMDWEGNQGRD